MLFRLNDDDPYLFPSPEYSEPDGLLAIGGDISPERLLAAYSIGIFPWYDYKRCEEPLWYGPKERFVIFPEEIHVSHSMRTLINSGRLSCTVNKAFEQVLEGCATSNGRGDMAGAWLGGELMEAYMTLHRQEHATSVEVWEEGKLVGGLIGMNRGLFKIPDGRLFVGDSMFSLRPSASKMALIHLARTMQAEGGRLIDCQIETPHLKSMGARYIPFREYMMIARGITDK